MKIGQNIKKYRKQKGLAQKELALNSGITRESIGNYERGDRIPPSDILNKIAVALGVPVSKLLEGDKDNSNSFNKIKETIENIEKIILREGYNPNLVYMKGTLDGLKIALKILNNESEEN